MSHGNAALTPRQRLRLARQVVDDGWSISAAADYFRVSYRACQVVCVSGHRLGGCSEVGVDSVGERDRELGQRLLPAGRDGALDQPRWRFSLV